MHPHANNTGPPEWARRACASAAAALTLVEGMRSASVSTSNPTSLQTASTNLRYVASAPRRRTNAVSKPCQTVWIASPVLKPLPRPTPLPRLPPNANNPRRASRPMM